MKPTHSLRVALATLVLLLALPAVVRGQGSSLGSFTYQGRLNDASGPANGLFDFQFSLFPAGTGTNNQVDTTITWLHPAIHRWPVVDQLGNAPSGTNNPTIIPATPPARFYRLSSL